MILHVVLLKPRENLSPSERRAFIAAFERAATEIPTVRAVSVGRRVRHSAGYESSAPDAADFIAIIEFDDLAGLQAYLQHPAHQNVGEQFGRAVSSALVYDFEMAGELEDLV